jgi:hypothetical protein
MFFQTIASYGTIENNETQDFRHNDYDNQSKFEKR